MEKNLDPRYMNVEEYRQLLRKHGANEEQFTDDQILVLQDFINRLAAIIADEIIEGNLSFVKFQENPD